MSFILFYSNYCNNSSEILQKLSTSQVKNDIHFISIDNRIRKPDGSTYIILKNREEMILPHTVDKVPALLLLNRGNQVIFGNKILEHLQPVRTGVENRVVNLEPMAFSFNDMNSYGVTSDNYSFLDQTPEDLSAKGQGGLRQLRNNVTWETQDNIETPPDDYIPNKIGEISLDKIQQERNQSLKQ
jgi:hypothetical protein